MLNCPNMPIGGGCIYAVMKNGKLCCDWNRKYPERVKAGECNRNRSIKEWKLKNIYHGPGKAKRRE